MGLVQPNVLFCGVSALLSATAWAQGEPSQAKPSIAVMEITASGGVDQGQVDLFRELLQSEIRDAGFDVISARDVDRLLTIAQEQRLAGCEDNAVCIAEIAGALGVDEVIYGSVGRIGTYWVIAVTRADRRTAKIIQQWAKKIETPRAEALIEQISPIVGVLFGAFPGAAATNESAQPIDEGEPWLWGRGWTWVAAAGAVGFAGAALITGLRAQSLNDDFNAAVPDSQEQDDIRGRGKRFQNTSNAMLALAGVSAGAAIVLYFLESPEESTVVLSPGTENAMFGAQLRVRF